MKIIDDINRNTDTEKRRLMMVALHMAEQTTPIMVSRFWFLPSAFVATWNVKRCINAAGVLIGSKIAMEQELGPCQCDACREGRGEL